MAAMRSSLRSQSPKLQHLVQTFRPLSSAAAVVSGDHHRSPPNHRFRPPNEFLNSWKPPKDPKEAEANLAELRRDYAKQVKQLRKEYIEEMELQRLEKQRKDEARREAIRAANEERRAAKAASRKVIAAQREIALEEFRQTLLKERAQKLEYWRMKQNQIEDKKKEKNEVLHRQSSMWVDEADLEKKILEAIVDTTPL
ncbi:uncharacterized protein LOC127810921 [Diospyros lotus]|uniref:uncharacterized protein LOC127810921 n=1 Tax=Diospyros lotus TaxID=55363 RepID=UPI002251CF24|nr:uncharacterized protein LOC127810921 [Diospyros lotus]